MWQFNQKIAYGSECRQWQTFVKDCFDSYGCSPQSDKAEEIEVSDDFYNYYMEILNKG